MPGKRRSILTILIGGLVLIAIFLIFTFLAAGCTPIQQALATPTSTPAPCAVQAAAYLNQTNDLFNRFDEKNTLASSTSRGSLAPIVDELQNIKLDVEALEHPPCALDLHRYLVSFMEFNINAYLSFMRDEPEKDTENWIYNAGINLDKYTLERAIILAEQ